MSTELLFHLGLDKRHRQVNHLDTSKGRQSLLSEPERRSCNTQRPTVRSIADSRVKERVKVTTYQTAAAVIG